MIVDDEGRPVDPDHAIALSDDARATIAQLGERLAIGAADQLRPSLQPMLDAAIGVASPIAELARGSLGQLPDLSSLARVAVGDFGLGALTDRFAQMDILGAALRDAQSSLTQSDALDAALEPMRVDVASLEQALVAPPSVPVLRGLDFDSIPVPALDAAIATAGAVEDLLVVAQGQLAQTEALTQAIIAQVDQSALAEHAAARRHRHQMVLGIVVGVVGALGTIAAVIAVMLQLNSG